MPLQHVSQCVQSVAQTDVFPRLQPSRKLPLGRCILGGERPLVCTPLVGSTMEAVLAELAQIVCTPPDFLELRADAWECLENTGDALQMLQAIRREAHGIPLLLTCRDHREGGFRNFDIDARRALYAGAVRKRMIDMVDLELACGQTMLAEIKNFLCNTEIHLILSAHCFQHTPSVPEMMSILAEEVQAGADIAKLAVMPKTEEDVLSLLQATLAFRREYPDMPLITISMGTPGIPSRLSGGFFGSDVTFAAGTTASAPGQLPLSVLYSCFHALYGTRNI